MHGTAVCSQPNLTEIPECREQALAQVLHGHFGSPMPSEAKTPDWHRAIHTGLFNTAALLGRGPPHPPPATCPTHLPPLPPTCLTHYLWPRHYVGPAPAGAPEVKIAIEGMMCDGCSSRIEKVLKVSRPVQLFPRLFGGVSVQPERTACATARGASPGGQIMRKFLVEGFRLQAAIMSYGPQVFARLLAAMSMPGCWWAEPGRTACATARGAC